MDENTTANGAILKVVKGGHDITGYLKGLDPDPQGLINLAEAKVKDEIVNETLDPSKGAVIVLDPAAPKLTTTDTKPGLTYTLHEGVTVEEMPGGDRKLGDGNPWTPTITIKGGASGFYSIEVDKK